VPYLVPIGPQHKRRVFLIEARVIPAVLHTHVVQLLVATKGELGQLSSWIVEYWFPGLQKLKFLRASGPGGVVNLSSQRPTTVCQRDRRLTLAAKAIQPL
jgi:hypothetical protein